MENKKFGYLLLGIAALTTLIIYMFNKALKEIIASSCSLAGHGTSCPMYSTLYQQTILSFIIVGLIVLIALYLIFSKPEKEIVIKRVGKKASTKKYDLSELRPDDKKIFNIIKREKTIFQAELIERSSLGKAKMTRILDRLEGKEFIERKRRGMTNIVVLK